MKRIILLISIFLISFWNLNAQSISCTEVYQIVTENYDSKDYTSCYGSSWLVKADYYRYDGMGFVVAYIKANDYDFNGKPYIFCGISRHRWSSFKMEGMYGSWGESFHEYIRDYTCDCY